MDSFNSRDAEAITRSQMSRVQYHEYMARNTTKIAALLRRAAFALEEGLPAAKRRELIQDLRHEATHLSK
jgi:hypothetical protein